jgi:hypothetical protein
MGFNVYRSRRAIAQLKDPCLNEFFSIAYGAERGAVKTKFPSLIY